MKKILACFLAILLIGCSTETSTTSSSSSGSATNNETTNTSTNTPSTNTASKKPETKEAFNTSGTIDEQTLYDSNGVLVKATELTYESSRAKLLLNVENNSDKKVQILSGTLGFSCNAVNNWMVHDGWINIEVPAGKKANDSAYLDYSQLQACGINGIDTLYLTLEVIFGEGYSNRIKTDPIAIKTKLKNSQDKELPFDEIATNLMNIYGNRTLQYYENKEIFNSANVRVNDIAYFTSSSGDKILVLSLFNDGDQVLNVDSCGISANGFSLCTGRWSSEPIIPGKKGYMSLELNHMKDDEDWKAMGITEVSDITLEIGVLNLDYDYLSEPQTINIHVADLDTSSNSDSSEDVLYSANGIRIISKSLTDDYSDVKWKLLIENSNDFEIQVSDGWGNKLSVNDYMIDYIMWSEYIGAHQSSIAEVEISKNALKDAGIDPDNLGVAEIELEIKDENYNDIDSPKISYDFSK